MGNFSSANTAGRENFVLKNFGTSDNSTTENPENFK